MRTPERLRQGEHRAGFGALLELADGGCAPAQDAVGAMYDKGSG